MIGSPSHRREFSQICGGWAAFFRFGRAASRRLSALTSPAYFGIVSSGIALKPVRAAFFRPSGFFAVPSWRARNPRRKNVLAGTARLRHGNPSLSGFLVSWFPRASCRIVPGVLSHCLKEEEFEELAEDIL